MTSSTVSPVETTAEYFYDYAGRIRSTNTTSTERVLVLPHALRLSARSAATDAGKAIRGTKIERRAATALIVSRAAAGTSEIGRPVATDHVRSGLSYLARMARAFLKGLIRGYE